MKTFHRHIYLLIAGCCMVLLPQSAKAQNTYSYSTISYNAETNTISSYAETMPDYNSQVYYSSPHAQSKIIDAAGNQLALQSTDSGSLSIEVSGNGSSSYTVLTGHWMSALYRQYYSNSPCNGQFYYSAYNDYYNYQHFVPTPSIPNTFGFYLFYGPGPQCYQYSPNTVLGQSTATASVNGQPDVTYVNASIPGFQGNFESGGSVQFVDLIATASQCNPYTTFTLTVNYAFNYNVQQVLGVTAKGFGNTSVSNWHVNSVTYTNDLSTTPGTGQAVMVVNNKNGGMTDMTYNKIHVTVKGEYQSGHTFSTVGSVRIHCP